MKAEETKGSGSREGFRHDAGGVARPSELWALGQALEEACPGNDCRIYLNTFRLARETDEALDLVTEGHGRTALLRELRRLTLALERMYQISPAVQEYRRGRRKGG